jgi:predicted DNA-binding protein (UPF0278 family)
MKWIIGKEYLSLIGDYKMKNNFTKEEQLEAMNQVVELINRYQLQIMVEHQIKVVPFVDAKEGQNAS